MDPTNQPGAIGFAYVPVTSGGALNTDDLRYTGVISGVTRVGAGHFRLTIIDPDSGARVTWPFGISITVGYNTGVTITPLFPIFVWLGAIGSTNLDVYLYDRSAVLTDPLAGGFTINILPI